MSSGPLSTGRSEMAEEASRLTSGLSVRQPLEGPFRPSLPFVLSEYLTAEERRQEKMRRKFERSVRLASAPLQEPTAVSTNASARLQLAGSARVKGSSLAPSVAPTSIGYHSFRPSLAQESADRRSLQSSYETASIFMEEEPKVINYKQFKILSMDEETKEKEAKIKREKNLQTLSDLEKLKEHYYQEYMEALRSKIDKQKQKIKRKEDILAKKINKREEKKRQENLSNRQRRILSIKRSGTFLRKIPKSHYYLIIGLEDQLRQQGKLKSQCDYDEFWDTIQRPEVYSAFFREFDQSIQGTSHPSIPQLLEDSDPDSNMKVRGKFGILQNFQPMVQIQESMIEEDEEALEGFDESASLKPSSARRSIVTHSKTGSATPTTPSLPRRGSIGSYARAAAAELDRKYPKMELPPLACFTLELGEQEKDPYEERLRQSIRKKSEGRKIFQKRIRTMFELAQTNSASTRRILANHDEVRRLGEGPSGQELARWMISLSDPNAAVEYQEDQEEDDEEYQTLTSIRSATLDPNARLSDTAKTESGEGDSSSSAPREKSQKKSNDQSSERTKLSSAIFSEETPRVKSVPQTASTKSKPSKSLSKSRSIESAASKPKTPMDGGPISPIIPLKLEEVAAVCETKEAKSLSTLWNNPSGRRKWDDL